MQFRREEIESFHATESEFDAGTGVVRLRYAMSSTSNGSNGSSIFFEERIELGKPLELDPDQERSFERLIRVLHAVAGTSYFKAAVPPVVSIDSGPLTEAELRFVKAAYDKGMREFAHTNSLPVPLPVEVRAKIEEHSPSVAGAPRQGVAVPVGGGKDSIVVLEALCGAHPVLVGVNPSPAARRIAEACGLGLVSIKRTLDPKLRELNASGALNGHVPITAIVSLIAVAAGYAHGYSTTVMALESSADEPTRLIGDVEVNHQWSKSSESELALREVLRGISPGIRYLSALRGISELEIASAFAGMPRYHRIFRSCNRAFALDDAVDGWCGDCPKCRFVYLMLATALDRSELVGIFGRDLLADPTQTQGFRDLLDPHRKPFECVGDRDESITAFEELVRSQQWSETAVVVQIRPDLETLRAGVPRASAVERRSPLQVLDVISAAAKDSATAAVSEAASTTGSNCLG